MKSLMALLLSAPLLFWPVLADDIDPTDPELRAEMLEMMALGAAGTERPGCGRG